MKKFIVVTTTFSEQKDAHNFADIILKERLASCIQITAIESIYWWKNSLEKANEFLCIIKTKKSLYKKLEKRIKEIHSYEVPEIVAIDIKNGSKDYLNWIEKETKK